jgi:DNA-directed RNA polymerase specialized sigma24 family protein
MRNGTSGVLNLFRQGDADAFEALFRQHQRAVYGWILRIVRNPATAEELTVETFWRIYRPMRGLIRGGGSRAGRGASPPRAALDWLRAKPDGERAVLESALKWRRRLRPTRR